MGIGTDIIEIERIRAAYQKHGLPFLEKHFTSGEQIYCLKHQDPTPGFAARFAAKEAVGKALGSGISRWKEVEIVHDSLGKPEVVLSGKMKERFGHLRIFVSLSHCKEYATAVAYVEGV